MNWVISRAKRKGHTPVVVGGMVVCSSCGRVIEDTAENKKAVVVVLTECKCKGEIDNDGINKENKFTGDSVHPPVSFVWGFCFGDRSTAKKSKTNTVLSKRAVRRRKQL